MATTKTPEQKAAEEQAAREKAEKAEAERASAEAANAEAEAEEAAKAAEEARLAAEEAERVKAAAAVRAAQASAAAPDDIVTLVVVEALVRRDEQTEIPVEVFEHELPVLRSLYGENFVIVTHKRQAKVAGFDANSELARLKRKYKVAGSNPEGADAVGRIYRDGRELAREAGVKYRETTARAPEQSVQSPARRDKVIRAS